jgi:hypothetical protein
MVNGPTNHGKPDVIMVTGHAKARKVVASHAKAWKVVASHAKACCFLLLSQEGCAGISGGATRAGDAARVTGPRYRVSRKSAQRSPIMMVAALVLPDVTAGMTEASATRSPGTP